MVSWSWLNRGFSFSLHFREELNWAACLLHDPAIWVNPYRRVPRLLFLPIALRLSPSNWSCAAISSFASPSTNQNGSFQPIWTMHYEQIKLRGFGVFICKITDQSGARSRNSSLYKLASPLSPWKLLLASIETMFPQPKLYHYSRAEMSHQCRAVTLELPCLGSLM